MQRAAVNSLDWYVRSTWIPTGLCFDVDQRGCFPTAHHILPPHPPTRPGEHPRITFRVNRPRTRDDSRCHDGRVAVWRCVLQGPSSLIVGTCEEEPVCTPCPPYTRPLLTLRGRSGYEQTWRPCEGVSAAGVLVDRLVCHFFLFAHVIHFFLLL